MLCTSISYAQITTFETKSKNPTNSTQSKSNALDYIFNINNSSRKVSNLVSYRTSMKRPEEKKWSDWVYAEINFVLDEDHKTLKISDKSITRLKYEGFTEVYDEKDGSYIYPSKATDQNNKPVKLIIIVGVKQTIICVGFPDIVYMYELQKK
jgi:hypothetical protein